LFFKIVLSLNVLVNGLYDGSYSFFLILISVWVFFMSLYLVWKYYFFRDFLLLSGLIRRWERILFSFVLSFADFVDCFKSFFFFLTKYDLKIGIGTAPSLSSFFLGNICSGIEEVLMLSKDYNVLVYKMDHIECIGNL